MPLALFTTDTYSIFAFPNKHRWLFQSRDLIILVRAALCGCPFSLCGRPFSPSMDALFPIICSISSSGQTHRKKAATQGSPYRIIVPNSSIWYAGIIGVFFYSPCCLFNLKNVWIRIHKMKRIKELYKGHIILQFFHHKNHNSDYCLPIYSIYPIYIYGYFNLEVSWLKMHRM